MTTILEAPAMRAPLTALSPTPPAPKITTESPALTFAVFETEPAPVTTPQPSDAAWAKGISFGTTASWFSWISACSAKPPSPKPLKQASSVAAQARSIAWSAQCRLWMLALEGTAREASRARSARLRQRPYNVIPNRELSDIGTDSCDDPRYFVTQHTRCGHYSVSGE